MRYHVIRLGNSIEVHAKNLTPVHARRIKRLLKQRCPNQQFQAVPVDAWNRIITYLENL